MGDRLKDRIAIVTGGGSGIGRATAFLFAESGARVVVADLESNGVEKEIASQYGSDSCRFMACNVAEEQQIVDLIRQTVEWGGRLDILCNVAGVIIEAKYDLQARCHEMDVEDFDQAMTVNARGVWLGSKYALKQMLAQSSRTPNARGERTRGWIVNVASIAGVVGAPFTPAYTPTKHAVIGMTKQMAIDYAQDRIHVNAVCPGYIKTPMTDFKLRQEGGEEDLGGRHPWNAMGTAEDCANAALFLASDDAAFVTGNVLMVDGGFAAR